MREVVMLPNARVCCLLLAPAFLNLSGSAAQTASKTPFSTPNRLSKQSGSDPCYRKLSSNDRLTVFAVTIAPHQSTLLASHPNDYLLISLEKSALEAAGVSGNSYVVQLDAEEMQVMKGGWSHRLTNVGETAANLLQVEVRSEILPEHALCGLAARPCNDGQFGKTQEGTYSTSTLFETPKVKLTKIELGPGGLFQTHMHAGPQVLIPLTSIHLADSSQTDIVRNVGEAQVYAAKTTHQLRNMGTEAARFLEFEVK
jgi:hypothetical protein